MPHPKRRQSSHRQGIRRSHLAIKTHAPNHCARCGSPIKTHRVCENCGFYGFAKGGDKQGMEIFRKDDF